MLDAARRPSPDSTKALQSREPISSCGLDIAPAVGFCHSSRERTETPGVSRVLTAIDLHLSDGVWWDTAPGSTGGVTTGPLLPKPSRVLGSLSLLQRQGSPIAPLGRELSEHKEQVSPWVGALDRVCGTKRVWDL